VISGLTNDYKNGTYRIDFFPHDSGTYTVEVVLTFFNAPPFHEFPLPSEREPSYEGWLLDGFPLNIEIYENNEFLIRNKTEWCSSDQLIDDNVWSTGGRWMIKNKVKSRCYESENKKPSIRGYQQGYNSHGIVMKYVQNKCKLFSDDQLDNGSKNTVSMINQCIYDKKKQNHPLLQKINIIFVGDSVMGRQYQWCGDILQKSNTSKLEVEATFIRTHGGIILTMESVKRGLEKIQKKDTLSKQFILFNTGLHDVAKLCSSNYAHFREKIYNITSDEFSCVELYRNAFQDLITYIHNYNAEAKIFRTTTAGWPKYGNFGFAWNPTYLQKFPFSSEFVEHFNKIALDVIQKSNFGDIHTLDGYWISLPRPGNYFFY